MAGPNKAKKATKRGNRGMGKQAQRSATATSGQLSAETMKQGFKTAVTTLLEENQQAVNNFKNAVQPLIGRARRANTGQAKTKTRTGTQAQGQGQNQGQGQRLAATG